MGLIVEAVLKNDLLPVNFFILVIVSNPVLNDQSIKALDTGVKFW